MDGIDGGPTGLDAPSAVAEDAGAPTDALTKASAAGRPTKRSVVAVLAALVLASTALLAAIFSGSAGASGTSSSPSSPAERTGGPNTLHVIGRHA